MNAGQEEILRRGLWKHRDDLPAVLNMLGLTGTGVEVGVRGGEFSEHILRNWPGRMLCVDAWKHLPDYKDMCNSTDEEHNHIANLARARLEATWVLGRAIILRELSDDCAVRLAMLPHERGVPKFDFVYLDADHSAAGTWRSILLWEPLIKRGGILAGHDYRDGELCEGSFGVKTAVDAWCGLRGYTPLITEDGDWPSWLVLLK